MEQLRILPILMLFVGILFVYAGIKNQSPTDIMRSILGSGANPTGPTYGPNVNPNYAGVSNAGNLTYSAPTSPLQASTF